MIKIENISKRFGEKVACNITEFTINKGEILGLVGNNGAGKTTLFRMILDLLQPDQGTITAKYSTEEGDLTIEHAQSEEWKKYKGRWASQISTRKACSLKTLTAQAP